MTHPESTTNQAFDEAVKAAAHAAVEIDTTEGRQAYSLAVAQRLNGTAPQPAMAQAPASEPKPQKKRTVAVDGFIKKHRDGYGWASKLLVQLDGHTTLGTIVKEGDRLSIAPFSTLPREKAICILHRAFQRGGKRFSKAVKSSEATADIEVWTKAAWEKHHEIQSEAA